MIVDQLNTELTGGAAVAGYRLHHTLCDLGVESRFWCKRLPAGFQEEAFSVLRFDRSGQRFRDRIPNWLRYATAKLRWRYDKWRFLRGRSSRLEKFSVPWLPHKTVFDPRVLSGDVLQLHWTTKFLDLSSFFSSLPDSHPIVWTQHDMSAFTGGCHHADGCAAFASHCGHCPQLVRPHAHDLSQRAFSAKLLAVRGKNLHIITPSRWMERLVRQSRIFAAARTVQTIYNGLNVQEFLPIEKSAAKRELGLSADRHIVAFGAGSLHNRRKGILEYLEAVSKVATQLPVVGLVFGEGNFPSEFRPSFPIHRVGFLTDPTEQARVYSASDVFVLSSLGENLAQTGVEALACGTPVVSFDVGGLSEYVQPGLTGLLAKLGDIDELAHHIHWLLEHPEKRREMGAAGRSLVEQEFDDVRQAKKYLSLYQSLLQPARLAA